MNANLADYHIPVNADIGGIDVAATDIPDPKLESLAACGIEEIGITETGAASIPCHRHTRPRPLYA